MIRDRDPGDENDCRLEGVASARIDAAMTAEIDRGTRVLALQFAVDLARPSMKPADVVAAAEAFLAFLTGRVRH